MDTEEVEVWINNATLTTIGVDLVLDVFYTFNVTEIVHMVAVSLLLSLDNMSHITCQTQTVDSYVNETDTKHLRLSNSIGNPIPFDLHKNEALYVWVEIKYYAGETWPGAPPALSRSPSSTVEVPIEYHTQLIVPEVLLRLSIVLISTAGVLGLIFSANRRKAGRSSARRAWTVDTLFIRVSHYD